MTEDTTSRGAEAPAFDALLRQHRRAAALTQEELAERAGLSPRSIQGLEHGGSRPYLDTVRRLARALALSPAEQAAFETAARAATRQPATGPSAARASGATAAPAGKGLPRVTPAESPTNLPVPVTSFIGRDADLAAVLQLLDLAAAGPATPDGVRPRLLTLTGPGGTGKTRLALAAAAADTAAYPDGVRLVELAALADPALVPQMVAAALGVREEPGRALLATLAGALRPKQALLVLDNCEHLLAACGDLVAGLLAACPRLQILATSREPLGIAGEQQWPVPPLQVPDASRSAAPDELAQVPAVQLFVARAQAVAPAFHLTAENAAAVAQVCVRLDGLPLALELAAARVPVLSVEQIVARLDASIGLLTGRRRAGPARHQTLRASLDWSHDLLSTPEQVVFRRLAVFAAGFTLDAAEAVCDFGLTESNIEVLDLLAGLVDQSLVVAQVGSSGTRRYRLHETVRQYARERLEASGEAATVRQRHAAYYLALAEREEPAPGTGEPVQADWLVQEHDNVRAALDELAETGEAERALQLGVVAAQLWLARGYFAEGRRRLTRLLALPGTGRAGTRAMALLRLGQLAAAQGDYDVQRSWDEEALAIFRQMDDQLGIANALSELGAVAFQRGDYAEARTRQAQALALSRDLGDPYGVATALKRLASVLRDQGDFAAAGPLYQEALDLDRAADHPSSEAHTLSNMGWLALYQGDLGAARARQQESLAIRRALGQRREVAVSLTALGKVAYAEGDPSAAWSLYEEALPLHQELGNRWGIALALEGLAELLAHEQPERALRLAAAADALRAAIGRPRPPVEQPAHAEWLARARDAAGAPQAAAGEASGVMSFEEAVTLAESSLALVRPAAAAASAERPR